MDNYAALRQLRLENATNSTEHVDKHVKFIPEFGIRGIVRLEYVWSRYDGRSVQQGDTRSQVVGPARIVSSGLGDGDRVTTADAVSTLSAARSWDFYSIRD